MLFAFAPSLDIAIVGRVLVGLSGGMSYLGALALAMIWFPRERYALLVGISMPFGIVGGVLGQGGVVRKCGAAAHHFEGCGSCHR